MGYCNFLKNFSEKELDIKQYGLYRDTFLIMTKVYDNDDKQDGDIDVDDVNWIDRMAIENCRKCQQEQSDLSLKSTWLG